MSNNDPASEFKWQFLERFSQVTRWTREKISELNLDNRPRNRPSRQTHSHPASSTEEPGISTESVEDDWEHVSLERWAQTIYSQMDALVKDQKYAERIKKGGIHLLMDEDLIREMDTRLGAFEWIQVNDDYDGHVTESVHDDPPPLVHGLEPTRVTLAEFDQITIDLKHGNLSSPISAVHEICGSIYKRGLSSNARPVVWGYLVGIFPWSADAAERRVIFHRLVTEYLALRNRWRLELQSRVDYKSRQMQLLLEDQKHRIEKDVVRTDPEHPVYSYSESDEQSESIDHGSNVAIERSLQSHPGWAQLRDILMTFATYRLDIGYVQGMSDIAAVIHCACVENQVFLSDVGSSAGGESGSQVQAGVEVEAWVFWLLTHFMHPLQSYSKALFQQGLTGRAPLVYNFHSDQSGLRTRLILVLYLIRILEPKFYSALGTIDGIDHHQPQKNSEGVSGATSLFWLFRSLLLLFRRDIKESETSSILLLWDGILSGRWIQSIWMEVWIVMALIDEYYKPPVLASVENPGVAESSESLAPGSPVDTFEGLLKLAQKLSGSMESKILLMKASKLFDKFVQIVQPPAMSIDVPKERQEGEIDISYREVEDPIPADIDSLKTADTHFGMITDVNIAIDEALCMLNTKLELKSER